ncbi:MAG: ATP-grasp domain-containing protein [Candidatus Paceibacterota bacterium]|jgi:D-alanine-D-alanine ligase|nr:ATP-grasp domain-containing protein [Candidatus Paceibacterota bacterium]
MEKIRVGVLRGGTSSEYEVSLKTGDSVLRHLPEHKYFPVDILITKDGTWHIGGRPTDLPKVSRRVDVVFNALHGEYGEDGKVQRLFEHFSIPFTGSRALPSALGMNKTLSKEIFRKHGLKTAIHAVVSTERMRTDLEDDAALQFLVFEILGVVPLPLVAKPVSGGSSVGTFIVRNAKELLYVIEQFAKTDSGSAQLIGTDIIFEEFIAGKEATCGVIDSFRGREHYSLLPVEIRPPAHKSFFDFESKYGGTSHEVCPGNFSRQESATLQNMAKLAHKALGLRHYSRSDFILGKDGIYILETNTLPGLTGESLLPKSLHAVGSNLPEFLDHVVTLAMK